MCLLATPLILVAASFAQAAPDEATESPPLKTVSATQPVETAETTPAQPPVIESFQLPAAQHAWARFQPGAWRETETITETFDETGHVVSRSVTTQKEVLQTVAEGKYVLDTQATVDLGGKRIVGEINARALHLETDGAGLVVGSRRLDDQSLQLAGLAVECQVWEIRYRDGTHILTDIIHYQAERFPFILRRETLSKVDSSKVDSKKDVIEAVRRSEVAASTVPYFVGDQMLDCCCWRSFRHRTKGETQRVAFASSAVPGGEVAVWSTDSDALGKRVRWSVTKLLAYGDSSPVEQSQSEVSAEP